MKKHLKEIYKKVRQRFHEEEGQKVIHYEGEWLWDHINRCLNCLDKYNWSNKEHIRNLIYYHDYGKILAWELPENKLKTQENLKQGKNVVCMTGHHKMGLDKMREMMLEDTEVNNAYINLYLKIIRYHMRKGLQKTKGNKLIQLVEDLPGNILTRCLAVDMLHKLTLIDAEGTLIKENGQVSEKNAEWTVAEVWKNYVKAWNKRKDNERNRELEQHFIKRHNKKISKHLMEQGYIGKEIGIKKKEILKDLSNEFGVR